MNNRHGTYYAVYELLGPVLGVGRTLENAIAEANRQLRRPIDIDILPEGNDFPYRFRDQIRWARCTEALADLYHRRGPTLIYDERPLRSECAGATLLAYVERPIFSPEIREAS